jgi:ATP-dependent Clp protease ATP-binding subunit ClpA
MFERFTDKARRVMAFAGREAQRYHHGHIGTEHILLGLMKEGTGIAATVLQARGIDRKSLTKAIVSMVQEDERVDSGALPQTPHAKHVIQWAIEEARALHHNYLGTEHLLLGLLRETEGMADHILLRFNVSLDDLRQDVFRNLGETASEGASLGPLAPDDAREMVGDMARSTKTPLKHIVMWTLKDQAAGTTKQENARQFKAMLEALPAQIPQIRALEVGLNQASSDAACDVVLISAFDGAADLETYQKHPAHQKVVAFARQIVDQRYVADY